MYCKLRKVPFNRIPIQTFCLFFPICYLSFHYFYIVNHKEYLAFCFLTKATPFSEDCVARVFFAELKLPTFLCNKFYVMLEYVQAFQNDIYEYSLSSIIYQTPFYSFTKY